MLIGTATQVNRALFPHLLLFLFSPQQVFFPGRQESHVDRSHCIPEGMSDASACRCRPRIPTEPFENEIQEVAACNLPQRASVDMEE